MANLPPLWPGPTDSQTDLLRKILTNLAYSIENGGGGGGAVTKISAGTGITISPLNGLGNVTINATGGGGGGNAYATATNASGNTTLTPTQPVQTTKLTFSGSAGNRIIILATAGRTAGDKLFLDVVLPATSGIVVSVRNATSGGTLLLPVESFPSQDFTTDGNVLSAHWEFTYTGTAWNYDSSNLPA